MLDLYDHIQELRRKLRGCRFTPRERVAVQAELANAIAEQAEFDRAFNAALEALSKSRRDDRGRRVRDPLSSSVALRPASGGPDIRGLLLPRPARRPHNVHGRENKKSRILDAHARALRCRASVPHPSPQFRNVWKVVRGAGSNAARGARGHAQRVL